MELILPHKHNKNASHWKRIEDWQKDTYAIKDIRKIHMELGRKVGKSDQVKPCNLGRNTEKEGDSTDPEIFPREWAIQTIYWVLQTWEDESS